MTRLGDVWTENLERGLTRWQDDRTGSLVVVGGRDGRRARRECTALYEKSFQAQRRPLMSFPRMHCHIPSSSSMLRKLRSTTPLLSVLLPLPSSYVHSNLARFPRCETSSNARCSPRRLPYWEIHRINYFCISPVPTAARV